MSIFEEYGAFKIIVIYLNYTVFHSSTRFSADSKNEQILGQVWSEGLPNI